MKRPTGAELRSSPKANRNAGITITKGFVNGWKAVMERPAGADLRSSPLGEPKRGKYGNKRFCQWMKGGNGVREANVVTLCLKCTFQTDAAEPLPWM